MSQTRREILKSTLSLAGIIAAGEAPAAVVKSLIGAQLTGNTEESGGWKNPYVTDGLIAMWDGEWNVGPGKHDPNAKVWKELMGTGCDLVYSPDAIINDMYAVNKSDTTSVWLARNESKKWFNAEDILAFEIVMKFSRATGGNWNGAVVLGIDGGTSLDYIYRGVMYVSDGGGNNFIFKNQSGGRGATMTTRTSLGSLSVNYVNNFSAYPLYWNNTEVTTGPARTDNMRTAGVSFGSKTTTSTRICLTEYYCVRLYNRNLLPADISYNYAVDKERFGI